MDEFELEAAANGQPLTAEQREWCLDQHEFLWGYTRLEGAITSDDQNLALDVLNASRDYVRCIVNDRPWLAQSIYRTMR